ncbi:MAG: hypothetical protein Q4D21_00665 [Phascolarctobacterium sp.]|nr:hypothetical protein [Phascolarctobacterium sp.]
MQPGKIVILAAMTFCMSLQHAFSAPINEVDVQVIDENGGTSQILLTKMSSSMHVVSEQLFIGKDDELVGKDVASYESLLQEIGERVFTGYELTRVDVLPAQTTRIKLYARPWSKIISSPKIDLQFSGLEAQTAKFLENRVPNLRQQLNDTISGASVDASDWAGGVLRLLVRKEIEKQLPEFKAAVDLVQENDGTIVQVVVYPVGQVVREITYELRSEDIPNVLLFKLKDKYHNTCDMLRGLPIDYVKKHKDEIAYSLTEELKKESEIHDYNLTPQIEIIPGSNLIINIMLASKEYRAWFEGYADLGRKDDNLSGKAHIGKYISGRDEIFGEVELVTQEMDWNFTLGATRDWGKSRWTYGRRMPKGENDYRFEYVFGPKWRLRAEHFSSRDRNEFGVRYRIHEFLSAEYVYDGHESYLRIIGNL